MAEAGTLAREIAAIPALAAARLAGTDDIAFVAEDIRRAAPVHVVTIGRGSSDIVCEGLARAFALELGLAAASLPPSLVTLDRARLDLRRALALVVSQSGGSPDIIEAAAAARRAGARVVGVVNTPGSPLADVCDHVLPAGAHPEISVAATGSMVLSWLTGLMLADALAAGRMRDASSRAAIVDALEAAVRHDWPQADRIGVDQPVLVLSRGAGLAVARELALKLRELAGLSCEAWSAAEYMHGPRAAFREGTRIVHLDLAAPDGARRPSATDGLPAPALSLRVRTGGIAPAGIQTSGDGAEVVLRAPRALPYLAEPPVACAALYPLARIVAERMGRDPDNPALLTKVTRTR
jgi:glucosamine--fructose-6-phosphate aminotransferase (isomerizing)